MKAQGNNIFFTVVEWWNRKRNDLDPVIQVLTKLPLAPRVSGGSGLLPRLGEN